MSWRHRMPVKSKTLPPYYDSRASTFLREFFTTESAKQFIIFTIDNNLTHDSRFVTILTSALNIRYNIPATTYFERLIRIINDNANNHFPCDFHNNLYMCYPPYRCFCDVKNGKQSNENHMQLHDLPNESTPTNKFVYCDITKNSIDVRDELWNIYNNMDEFAYCEFLTPENTKNYIIASFELKGTSCSFYLCWNYIAHIKYTDTIHKFLTYDASDVKKRVTHQRLCNFPIYIQFYKEFAQRKHILIVLCETIYNNYGHTLAERVLSNIYIMERVYGFL